MGPLASSIGSPLNGPAAGRFDHGTPTSGVPAGLGQRQCASTPLEEFFI